MSASPTERPEFRLGVRLHNEGAHYEAHEAWEHVWRDEENEAHRRFLQGLIQITAGCFKIVVEGMPGAGRRLLERGLEKLEGFPDEHLGVDLGALRSEMKTWMGDTTAPAASAARVDPASAPRLRFRART